MNLINKARAKFDAVTDYYLFRKLGIPKVKEEKISKVVLKKFLPSSPVIIDCGAHDGSDSIELVKTLGGQLHAFEPVPEIYTRLKRATENYSSITTYHLALSNKTGKDFFYVSEGGSDASSSLLPPKDHLVDHTDTFFNKKIEVSTITLDQWAVKYNIDHVDMLWLDMQGFEMPMLKESKTILPKVKLIHTEVSLRETYEGVCQYKDYKFFLESIGFKAIIEAIPDGWDMGNVLFAR